MASLVIGIACLLLGIIGMIAWRFYFIAVLKGIVPPLLVLIGALALFLGLDTLREKARPEEDREKPEELPEKKDSL